MNVISSGSFIVMCVCAVCVFSWVLQIVVYEFYYLSVSGSSLARSRPPTNFVLVKCSHSVTLAGHAIRNTDIRSRQKNYYLERNQFPLFDCPQR